MPTSARRRRSAAAFDEHAARVVKDALTWAQSGDADPEQCARLADLVAKLRFVRSPSYYAKAGWRQDHLAWSSRSDAVYSAKKLSDLENVLRETHKLARRNRQGSEKHPRTGRRADGRSEGSY